MPMTPGLGAATNIRQLPQGDDQSVNDNDIIVQMVDEGGDVPEFDQSGAVIKIEHDDGSITVSLDGKPIEDAADDKPLAWFDNLVEKIDQNQLGLIANDLLRGVDDDLKSRIDWIENRSQGIKLLGLTVQLPGIGGSSDGAPVEGMSRVQHPLLQEAVLRFQANARSELLPTDGPMKIRNDDNNATLGEDQLANALERDMNHYLTSTATEYYPDTDRMLLMLGFGGTAFKKVYFCPLRNRPVSETVDADDLIVNEAATDLRNAKRITHRSMMRPSTVKRLQILGVYRDIDLSIPLAPKKDAVRDAKKDQQGISASSSNPEDRDREIYECYCELDIPGFEHKIKGKPTGLEIPYRVTIDVSSREILSIVRNFNEDTKDLPEARMRFVKYTFVPGMGFYDIGLLHILGNTTNAITAAWRELLDAGMFSNFPGFLFSDAGGRQETTIFRVPPGGGAKIKTGGMPINQAVMPLPYKEPSQALMALVNDISQTGMRVGGTSETQVGEGRPDAPVGTTLAMIDQATKVLNSVHKRMHAAQAEEFRLLVECFREHPESFWQRNKKPARQWDQETFLKALDDCDLVPQADPNTASHSQRVMKIMGLKQLQAGNPNMYDAIAIDTAALQAMGWSNPQQFFAPPSAQSKPSPEDVQKQAAAQADTVKAQASMISAQSKQAETQAKIQQGAFAQKPESVAPQADPNAAAELQIKAEDAKTKAKELAVRIQEAQIEAQSRAAEDATKERISAIDAQKDHTSDLMDIEKEKIAAKAHTAAKGVDK